MPISDHGAPGSLSEEVVDVAVLGENSVSPEVVELHSGERIRWSNRTNQPCVISFGHPSPFDGGIRVYEIPPSGTVMSNRISERAPKAALAYVVKIGGGADTDREEVEYESLSTPTLNPTVIIKNPNGTP